MLVHGRNRNPVLTGSSVHNQRIERLWRDTCRCALSLYYQIFYYLEDRGELDPDSELDLFCLHLVYHQKINFTLMDGWNNHAITTEHNMTPMQLFTCGVLMQSRPLSVTVGLPQNLDANDLLQRGLSVPSVVVPPIENPLTSDQLAELRTIISTHISSDVPGDYGIETYLLVKRHLSSL